MAAVRGWRDRSRLPPGNQTKAATAEGSPIGRNDQGITGWRAGGWGAARAASAHFRKWSEFIVTANSDRATLARGRK
jgi:hypothetical protein